MSQITLVLKLQWILYDVDLSGLPSVRSGEICFIELYGMFIDDQRIIYVLSE